MLAGQLFEKNTVDGMDVIPAHASAWSTVFYIMAIAFLFLSVYHFAFLPNDKKRLEIGRTSDDEMLSVETYGRTSQNGTDAQKTVELDGIVASLKNNFKSFFAKFTGRELILALLFIFTYRLGELVGLLFAHDGADHIRGKPAIPAEDPKPLGLGKVRGGIGAPHLVKQLPLLMLLQEGKLHSRSQGNLPIVHLLQKFWDQVGQADVAADLVMAHTNLICEPLC